MSWRTVIIEGRCKLDYRMGYLVVRSAEVRRVFLEEIAVLMIENPAVSLTGCLLEALIEHKIRVIFCDVRRNPVAELEPLHGCHDSSMRIKAQMQWTEEAKASVWQAIVREKIKKQAALLLRLGKGREHALLSGYIGQVMPGDVTNREGHAARVFFNALFGMDFITAVLSQRATAAESFERTSAILSNVELWLDDLAFGFPCDIIFPGISAPALIKAAAPQVRCECASLAEKVLDYIELVEEFDRPRLFFTLNMRAFVPDDDMALFAASAISHGYHVIGIECVTRALLPMEKRVIIDADLCEIG